MPMPNQPGVQGAPAGNWWDKVRDGASGLFGFAGDALDVLEKYKNLDRENGATERGLPDVATTSTTPGAATAGPGGVMVPQKAGFNLSPTVLMAGGALAVGALLLSRG